MRRFLSLLSAVVFSVIATQAQSLDAFKEQLARPAAIGTLVGAARVTVTEYGDAAKIVNQAVANSSRSRLRGFRVCIFFDNGQDARVGAASAKSLFETTYPQIGTYMVYENPYFKVSVGNCVTVEEAIILKGRVSTTFPKAFLKSEELSLLDFAN
ncbi:MAG: hypothetical protein RR410_00835 [Alistipes sp.]